MRGSALLAAALAVTALLAGCATDPLAEDYRDGGTENYISGSGILEVPGNERGDAVVFEGVTDEGDTFSSAEHLGEVLVVNFWYASCEPCRREAPDLEALSGEYDGEGASFVGVNVRDGAETSLAFSRTYGIGYPSVLDAGDGDAQLAFAGDISPSAVPTTFVLDREGRIAARILGQLEARSILDTIIGDVLDEGPA